MKSLKQLSRNQRMGLFFGAIGATVLLSYQNCAEVQFIDPTGAQKNAATGTVTTRVITLKPSASSSTPTTPAKILLVIDNSKSMVGTQEKLRASLKSLLLPLQKHPVSVKIITTSSVASVPDLEEQGWSVKNTTLSPNTPISADWKSRFQMQDGDVFANGYDVYYTLNRKNLFELDAQDAQFDSKIESIKSRILFLSELTAGSDREQPLCNTLLALYDRGPNQFFNKGDFGAVVVITDEDDGSRWHTYDTTEHRRDCRNRYTYGAIGNPSHPAQDRVDYTLGFWGVRFQVSYDLINDGAAEPKTGGGDNGGLPVLPAERSQVAGRAATEVLACTDAQRERALGYARYLFPSPKYANVKIAKCEVKSSWTALYGFGEGAADRCSNRFTANQVEYANLYDYYERAKGMLLAPGQCKRVVTRVTGYRSFSQFYIDGATDPNILNAGQLPANQHGESIKRALVLRATELFESSSFFHSAIIHKDRTCVGANQSVATRYADLGDGSAIESAFRTVSICSSTYDTAMTDLSQRIKQIVDQKIALPTLESGESIVLVELIRAGTRSTLQEGVDYTIEASTIRFLADALKVDDTVEITIERAP